ncbi:MAG: hypothetical protein IPH01_11075 [Elusimicrobia bacterium]|jgi:hypothetical protein|nr:hypothetical protein [Elusimicrobiota bacterium]MBK7546197.1 hypothetical protein [Elusimicrobiota bacterium]MBK8424427.1 hypothetical protein [Elusimicrobiota bacterium]MBK8652177.1 hypothetical protein [Elusimicrobiota bacterium]MBK9058102.1 hypothetical protein [Elusimicrobiota bacterium]
MAASVHELLAAAQADKSPFISMLEGAAQGFQSQQMHPLDVQSKQLAIQRQQQALEFDKMLRTAYEQTIKNQLNDTAPEDGGQTPQQKFDTVVSIGKGGPRVSQVPRKKGQATPNKQQSVYEDEQGRSRRGAFDPATGQVIRTEQDPIVPMNKPKPAAGQKPSDGAVRPKSPSQMQSENTKAFKMAVDWYVKANPNMAVTDPFSGRVIDTRMTYSDTQTEEFTGLFERAKKLIAEGVLTDPASNQPPASPSAPSSENVQSPEQYLKSIGAKITPANIEWAKKKTGGK